MRIVGRVVNFSSARVLAIYVCRYTYIGVLLLCRSSMISTVYSYDSTIDRFLDYSYLCRNSYGSECYVGVGEYYLLL